jgi:hypothetical protein
LIERLRQARPAPKIYLQATAGSQQHFILAKPLLRAQPEPRRASIAEINRGRGTADQGGNHGSHSDVRRAVSAAALLLSPIAFAQQTGGTADEAKAMLMKAVAAVKADKAKALNMFNKGEGGFLDRDLYVFCFNAGDGKQVANGNPNAKQLMGV